MLFYETVEERTLQLLKYLLSIKQLDNFSLVGGTSLALQIGHRVSIDLDLFSNGESSLDGILEEIESGRIIKITSNNTKILAAYIDDIKVDFVNYRYKLIKSIKPLMT